MLRIVADLGNSRLKVAALDARSSLGDVLTLPADAPARWQAELDARRWLDRTCQWAISSVNPPASAELEATLARAGVSTARWYRSAADVNQPHALRSPETTGADRALAVLAARARARKPGPGIVVLCGTAVTVECLDKDGIWRGGAITAGLPLLAMALNVGTAQLPEISIGAEPPPALGADTRTAIQAGVYHTLKGAVRELVVAQWETVACAREPWVVCSGGDAELVAGAAFEDQELRGEIVPNLVMMGLAHATLAYL